MKKIGLFVNQKKLDAMEEVKHVASLAAGMGFSVYADAEVSRLSPMINVCDNKLFARLGVEGVVVLGGDGTMLEAAHRLGGQRLPLMGLNMGSLGYLTSVEQHQFSEALHQLREDRYQLSARAALATHVVHASGEVETIPDALNDVVVSHGASGRAIELELSLNDLPVASFLSDGVIIATATGSTAYSLSAGGPIVLPDATAFVINVICPHTLTFRPLVVKAATRIAIRVVSCPVPSIVSSDGRDDVKLQADDKVEIVRSEQDVHVIELNGYNACDVLCRKLRWGHTERK
jgi:NAD+ kinase